MAVRHRLHRSELAVPGSSTRMLEKAPKAGADVVFLDLEDAVAPDDKVQARANVIDALNELDWSACSVSVRINGLDRTTATPTSWRWSSRPATTWTRY
jgi:malyl-CoA/(S)-citramalyl-CoA lyase